MKVYLFAAVGILMLITSMGIFGYLSKAHVEQNAPTGNHTLKIERFDQMIDRQQDIVSTSETVIDQLDGALQTLIEYDKIKGDDGYRSVSAAQKPQRDSLLETIDTAQAKIDQYEDEKLTLSQELQSLELELGPIKYIAALIYDEPEGHLGDAVRIITLLLVFVFDPLAVVLLIVSARMLHISREERKLNPRTVKTEEVMIVDNPIVSKALNEDPTDETPRYHTNRPAWLEGARATTKGWVDDNGHLLKAMKLTKEQVKRYNGE